MALSIMANGGGFVTAKQDGAMYNALSQDEDYVISGIGNEFECEVIEDTLLVSLGTGLGVICGRSVYEVTEKNTNSRIQLDSNDSGFLVIRMDLTKPAGSETTLTTTPTLYRENINGTGKICDLPLYSYTTGATSVTSFIDVREIKNPSE